jgi:hypothetical protein
MRAVIQVGGDLFAEEAWQPHTAPLVRLGGPPHQLARDLGGGLDHLAASTEQV